MVSRIVPHCISPCQSLAPWTVTGLFGTRVKVPKGHSVHIRVMGPVSLKSLHPFVILSLEKTFVAKVMNEFKSRFQTKAIFRNWP